MMLLLCVAWLSAYGLGLASRSVDVDPAGVRLPGLPDGLPETGAAGARIAPDLGGGPVNLGDIEPSEIFTDARFAINSVAMRDCRMGAINLVGPPPGSVVIKAYLYWQWGCLETPITGIHDRVRFKQAFPVSVGAGYVPGVLRGSGPNPCWCGPQFSNFTYRADVTPFVSPTGGGTYGVILHPAGPGSVDYKDPWSPFLSPGCPPALEPLFEGAALVVIYRSACEPNGTVCLYDTLPLTGTLFLSSPGVTYTLLHPPTPAAGVAEARWAHASCDGQSGSGYLDVPASTCLGRTNTFVNGGPIAGPGTPYNDSDFNGSAGKPLPQLFESSGHDVTVFMTGGGVPVTAIGILDTSGAGCDCIVLDLNVLFFR